MLLSIVHTRILTRASAHENSCESSKKRLYYQVFSIKSCNNDNKMQILLPGSGQENQIES